MLQKFNINTMLLIKRAKNYIINNLYFPGQTENDVFPN